MASLNPSNAPFAPQPGKTASMQDFSGSLSRPGAGVTGTSAAQKTVLCVDDSPAILQLTGFFLAASGFDVLLARGGQEGLQIALSQAVDAVVLDYDMPDLDGGKVAQSIRAAKPTLPIILYSGHSYQQVQPAMPFVDGYVKKGCTLRQLELQLRRYLVLSPHVSPTRRFPRFGVHVQFWLTLPRSDRSSRRQGLAFDLGEGGLGGFVDGDLIPGELVEIQLALPTCGSMLESRAAVRYRNGGNYGFEFVQLSEAHQVRLQRCCRELGA